MSYYKLFCEYSTQSAFTSNTKFFDINDGIYNTKINEDNNKDEPKPKKEEIVDKSNCKCSSCSV